MLNPKLPALMCAGLLHHSPHVVSLFPVPWKFTRCHFLLYPLFRHLGRFLPHHYFFHFLNRCFRRWENPSITNPLLVYRFLALKELGEKPKTASVAFCTSRGFMPQIYRLPRTWSKPLCEFTARTNPHNAR